MANETTLSDLKRETVDLAFVYRAIAWLEGLPPVLKKVARLEASNLDCYRLAHSLSDGIGIAEDENGIMLAVGIGMDWIQGLPVESVTIDRDFINILVRSFTNASRSIPAFVIQLPIPIESPMWDCIGSNKQIGFALCDSTGEIKRVNGVFPLHMRNQ